AVVVDPPVLHTAKIVNIEPGTVTSSIILGEQPINPFTTLPVSPEVIQQTQAIKGKLLGSSAPKPEVDKAEEALAQLKDKTPEQALKAISNAIGRGDDKLVKAMMDVIDKPPEGITIPQVGKVALTKVYTDQLHSTKTMNPTLKDQVQNAAGAIASKAGVNHRQQVALVGPKGATQGR
nr:hypothetical protein [Rickettsiaceae bacterium]